MLGSRRELFIAKRDEFLIKTLCPSLKMFCLAFTVHEILAQRACGVAGKGLKIEASNFFTRIVMDIAVPELNICCKTKKEVHC